MSTDNLKGTGNQIKGSVKETAGKATGDHALEGEGLLDKANSAVGTVKDAAHSAADAAARAKDKVTKG